MDVGAPKSRSIQATARRETTPLAVELLLQERCQCHAGHDQPRTDARTDLGVGYSTCRSVRPQLPIRMLRPMVRHLRTRTLHGQHDLDRWNNLGDDDCIPVVVADDWIEAASESLRDPALGLHALAELRRGGSDIVELAAECAATLAGALSTLIRYAHLLCEAADLHLHVAHGCAALELRYSIALSPMTRDFLAGGLVRALRAWLGGTSEFELWFSGGRRTRAALYEAAFAPLRVHFGSSYDAIVFPEALLDTPLRTADAAIHAALVRAAEGLASARARPASLAEQVRLHLAATLSSPDGHSDRVADAMGVSRRTLTRRLQLEGVSLSDLLEEVRVEQSLYYLERTNLTPHEIARRLGYSCTATFCRAFQRWQGTSPLSHRRSRPSHVLRQGLETRGSQRLSTAPRSGAPT